MGIFDNANVGEGQTAVTVQEGVSNRSKQTAIESLQSLDPVIRTVAEKFTAPKDYSEEQDKTLANFSESLRGMATASKLQGGLTKQEMQARQWQMTNEFVRDNPHLRDRFEKIAKTSQETFGATDESDAVAAQRAAEKADVQEATSLGLIDPTETDPTAIAKGVAVVKENKALISQMDKMSKQLSLDQAQLNVAKSRNEVGNMATQNDILRMQHQTTSNEFALKMYGEQFVNNNIPTIQNDSSKILANIDPSVPETRINAIQKLEEQKLNIINTMRASGALGWGDQNTQNNLINRATGHVDMLITQLKGDTSLTVVSNMNEQEKQLNTYNLINGEFGKNWKNIASVRSIAGETAAGSAIGHTTALETLFAPDDTGNGKLNSILAKSDDGLVNQSRPQVLSAVSKVLTKANSTTDPKDKAYYVKQGEEQFLLVKNALVPDENGKLDNKATQRALEKLAGDEWGKFAIENQPKYTEAAQNDLNTLLRNQHAGPAIQSIHAGLATDIPGSNHTVADLVQMYWRDGRVAMVAKEGLSKTEQEYVNKAIVSNRDNMGGLTSIVKATAHMNNSGDYNAYLDDYTKGFWGVENVSSVTGSGKPAAQASVDAAKSDLDYLINKEDTSAPAPTATPAPTVEPTKPARPGSFREKTNNLDASTTSNTVKDNSSVAAVTEADVIEAGKHPDVVGAFDKRQEEGLIQEMFAQKYSPAEIQRAVNEQRARFQELRNASR